jgi:1-acyl-sn-glycerol-3-phosphate acyltransferase
MLYRVFFSGLRVVLGWYLRLKRVGAEHIPSTGPVILAGNHVSNVDPFLIAFGLPVRRPAHFMAKAEMFESAIGGWFFRGVHQFPVNRGKADRGAIREAASILKANGVVGIFPEGTRRRAGKEPEVQQGAAFIALMTGAPVVPVGSIGAELLGGGVLPKRGPIVSVFGEPVDPAAFADLPKSERVPALTAVIMRGIASCRAEAEAVRESLTTPKGP